MIKGKYRYADHTDLTPLFGTPAGGHLPDVHMEVVEQGYRVILLTKEERQKRGYSLLRIMVECKACKREIPAGRMIQHEPKCWRAHGYVWENLGFIHQFDGGQQ